jgi:hypothetical protein
MKIHYLSFAYGNKKFFDIQKIKHSIFVSLNYEINNILRNEKNIYENHLDSYQTLFLKKNSRLGYFAWKPMIIKNSLKKINNNEILIYSDVMDIIHPSFIEKIAKTNFTDLILLNGFNKNGFYTKSDCFDIMGCASKDYFNCTQLEAGLSIWKKTQFSLDFLDEWQNYCFNLYANGEDENLSGKPNDIRFVAHRHDQSILTNLQIKYHIPKLNSGIRDLIECNIDGFYKKKQFHFRAKRKIVKLLYELKSQLDIF